MLAEHFVKITAIEVLEAAVHAAHEKCSTTSWKKIWRVGSWIGTWPQWHNYYGFWSRKREN
jgi:hypothetical protein